jgi:SAM-dependent methyltransferase
VPTPPAHQPSATVTWPDLVAPLALGLLTAATILGVQAWRLPPGPLSAGVMFGLPAVLCYSFLERPLRFGLGLGALFLAGLLNDGLHGRVEYRQRSFFGVHRITTDRTGTYRLLFHGNTVHGQQSLDPARRGEPLTYYHRTGPVGVLFQLLEQGHAPLREVAVVGLGSGSLAAYGRAGQHWTYYEIDPAVVDIARDSGYFTFLRDCPASLDFVLGDARLRLAQAEGRHYDLLIIDAFGSDATPVHLLTREALRVYLDRLAEEGVLAFHISNRYLELQPVLAELARDAGLVCLAWADTQVSADAEKAGKYASSWVVMSRTPALASTLQHRSPWGEARRVPGQPVWTDDYSDLLRQLK